MPNCDAGSVYAAYRKSPSRIADVYGAQARRHVRLLHKLVERPDLEHGVVDQVLLHKQMSVTLEDRYMCTARV